MDGCDGTLQNSVPSTWDINEIVRLLRQERLFVTSEQQELQSLNEKVAEDTARISRNAWVTTQQRVNLNKLIVSRPDCSPAACCQRANSLETTLFVDANKILQYQDVVAFAEFLRALRLAPELVAQCLVVGERVPESAKLLPEVVQCLVTGLYGNLILPDDTLLVLQLLRQLAKLQLASSDNPRRLLRNGSCAFSRLYSTFHEGLFSAKLFLTATLQGPIMHLLTETEHYFEIDPSKAVIRLSPAERIKKFGREGTPEYAAKVKKYRAWIIQNLVNITNRFIASLQENIHCFPKSVCWLVKHIASMLNKTLEPKEVNAMITDLVFTHFICLAIVNPEVYGVCDAPISPVARFNLMQVGRILQMLSLMKHQEADQKLSDLYTCFDQNAVPSLLEGLINGMENPDDGPISVNAAAIQGVKRNSALFTVHELQCMVTFLQHVHSSLTQEQAIGSEQGSQSSSYSGSDGGFSLALRDQLGMLISALPTTVMNGTSSPKKEPQQNGICLENGSSKRANVSGILGKVSKSRLNRASSSPGFTNHTEENSLSPHNSSHKQNSPNIDSSDTVLIIPLLIEDNDHIGLLTEQKVLSMDPIQKITNRIKNLRISNLIENLIPEQDCEERDRLPDPGVGVLTLNSGQEKRTRFLHSHDEGSIGNTSDNLEAISEAASNHSVASSLELENEDQNDNDNLSDMVSANVSGRGTPNISGRDTPSSQVTEGEERQLEVRQVYLPPPQSLIGKQIRSEIDDKFCKFEIKKLLEGDETISIISDTWSTDVLASDSEIIEAHDRTNNIPPPIIEQPVVEPAVQQLLDVSETASESAWSTDVLASDSERMTEVDTDDTASVARSDDTARSEVDETPPIVSNLLPENPQIPVNLPSAPIINPVSTNPFVVNPPIDNSRPLLFPQSPTVSYVFRPIKDDVPNSPTRNDFNQQNFNVTGRGGRKSDYRRRTVEYVDSNANNVVHNSVVFSENNLARNVSNGVVNHVETIERSILRTSNIHTIENIGSRREAILIDPNLLNSNGFQLPDRKSVETSTSEEVTNNASCLNNDIVMAAVSPAFLLANHVGAQKFIPKTNKNENDMIRSSNASLNSMSSGSSSSSESRNKTCNGLNPEPVDPRVQWTVENKQWVSNGSENSLNITSTPSGSTSELSVLSPTNTQLSPVSIANKNSNPSAIKPSTSTGAIPKSISFDMTAEKGDKELDDDKKNNRGFFGKLRMGFRNRRGKSIRAGDDLGRYDTGDGDGLRIRRLVNVDPNMTRSHASSSLNNESSEDILAKYRRKPSIANDNNTTDLVAISTKSKGAELEDERLNIDPANIEGSFAFVDAKKKLRLVLSTSDVQFAPLESKQGLGHNMNELVAFLQLQLARARNLKDWPLVARVTETLRCVRLFDNEGCRKLCLALKEDYCKRSLYNQYLLRCRQVLLSTRSYLDSLQLQIKSERELSSTCLVAVCVRLFLERQESHVISFCEEFGQLKVSDEKTDLLESFLQTLASDLEKDSIWQVASPVQLEHARVAIEHTVMSRVYLHALYPNGDADLYRDQVLSEHIRKLSRALTPNHKDLQIDKTLQYECPWPSAQEALAVMAAYKTPRDKVQCVLRCACCIMDLLSMSSERVPTADDFTPVLVYVIIKANPQSLLSTIQYVNCFYGNRLCGEAQYWWTQFCASVEFIKTMEYTD